MNDPKHDAAWHGAETAQPKPTAADVLRLDHLLAVFRVGSGDWSWQEEHDLLYARPWQTTLTQQIAAEGIREPVLLGSDGRVWDGHHRICAAMHLGLDTVPVEWANDAGLAEHDAQVAAQAAKQATKEAIDLLHSEARWQYEQHLAGYAVAQAISLRMSMLEQILRDRLAGGAT